MCTINFIENKVDQSTAKSKNVRRPALIDALNKESDVKEITHLRIYNPSRGNCVRFTVISTTSDDGPDRLPTEASAFILQLLPILQRTLSEFKGEDKWPCKIVTSIGRDADKRIRQ